MLDIHFEECNMEVNIHPSGVIIFVLVNIPQNSYFRDLLHWQIIMAKVEIGCIQAGKRLNLGYEFEPLIPGIYVICILNCFLFYSWECFVLFMRDVLVKYKADFVTTLFEPLTFLLEPLTFFPLLCCFFPWWLWLVGIDHDLKSHGLHYNLLALQWDLILEQV